MQRTMPLFVFGLATLIVSVGACHGASTANDPTTYPAIPHSELQPSPRGACARFVASNYAELYGARVFATARVGLSGSEVPVEIRALACLIRTPMAAGSLVDLVRNGTIPGKLYGLAGLQLTDSNAFADLAGKFAFGAEDVETISGDTIRPQRVSKVVERIRRGEFAQAFSPVLDPEAEVARGTEFVREALPPKTR